MTKTMMTDNCDIAIDVYAC